MPAQTSCCPSPDYCCPNSVNDCKEPGAILFDAMAARGGLGVPRAVIAEGWTRHYLAKSLPRPPPKASRQTLAEYTHSHREQAVCEASEWSDGRSGRHGCLLAMTAPSTDLVREVRSFLTTLLALPPSLAMDPSRISTPLRHLAAGVVVGAQLDSMACR